MARAGTQAGSSKGQGWTRPGTARIAGVEFEVEPVDDGESPEPVREPGKFFPARKLRAARPLSEREKREVATWKSILDAHRAGPFWTGLDSEQDENRHPKGMKPSNSITNPFEHGVETYSQRYSVKKRKTAAPLQGRTFLLKYLPRELWEVIDPQYTMSTGPTRKKAKIDVKKARAKLDALPDDEKAGEEEPRSDEEAGEEIVDDEFEEDEDDMAGDYNAEQYFDDGGDDAGDDYDGGDGGGDDGMY